MIVLYSTFITTIIVIVNLYKKGNKYEKTKTRVVIYRGYRFKSEKKKKISKV